MNIADETFLALSSLPTDDKSSNQMCYDNFLYALSCLFQYISTQTHVDISNEKTLQDELNALIDKLPCKNAGLMQLDKVLVQWSPQWYQLSMITYKASPNDTQHLHNIKLAMLKTYDAFVPSDEKNGYMYNAVVMTPLSYCTES